MKEFFKVIQDIDNDKVIQESLDIIDSVGYKNNQISLQYTDEVSWHNDVDYYGKHRNENDCVNYHPDLDNTYIKQVLTGLDFPVASARIMLLPNNKCYTTHVDLYTRYHIPIKSDSYLSYMVFPDLNEVVRMPYGSIYWTDTHELHTFINGTLEDRIHIIFNDASEDQNLSNPYLKKLYGDRF